MNFLRKAQKVACAERIVFHDLGCDWVPADVAPRMRRTFRKMLNAGGNEYDAAIGFVVGIIQERFERTLPNEAFTDRVCDVVDLIDGLLPKTLLWKIASDTPAVLAELRLLAARKPLAEMALP